MKANLHIFNDPMGFFTNKTVDFIERIIKKSENIGNIYVNTATNCQNRIDKIQYKKLEQFLIEDQKIIPTKVIFHSYNYTNKRHVKLIKDRFKDFEIKFVWIFWSHEYYQLPEFLSSLYHGFSRQFYLRKLISFHVNYLLYFFKREVEFPFYLGLSNFRRSFKEFSCMAALVKDDFTKVMQFNKEVKYLFISYISVDDFPDLDLNFEKEKNEVMVGHSGTPIVNHYEILKELSSQQFKYNVFVPLSYGKPSYINKLRNAVEKNISNLNITFQTDYLLKEAYYKRINNVGFFILNSFCQQALGNVFFFLWSGTKVFLRKETSSYVTLKEKGFYVYSIEDDFIGEELRPLNIEQKQYNHNLTNQMIGEETVKESWLNLLNF